MRYISKQTAAPCLSVRWSPSGGKVAWPQKTQQENSKTQIPQKHAKAKTISNLKGFYFLRCVQIPWAAV